MKKLVVCLATLSLLVGFSSIAAPAKSAKQALGAVKYRQSLLQLVRSNVGALGGMAKGAIPMDAKKIEKNAMRIEQLSLMMADYFVMDTREFNLPTDALNDIWVTHDDFKSRIEKLTAAAASLKTTAQQGDESQFKPAIGALLKSCKGCHDKYKAE